MRGLGPDVVSVVGPMGVQMLDFFYSSIQLYILLSHFSSFIMIHISNKGEVGTISTFFTDHSKAVVLLWILNVKFCVSCLSCCLVYSLQPCGQLLRKG